MEKRKEGRSGSLGLVVMLVVVILGDLSNSNPLLSIKFCVSSNLIRKGLVEVIPKINPVHVLKLVS